MYLLSDQCCARVYYWCCCWAVIATFVHSHSRPAPPQNTTAAGRHQFKVHTACSLDLDLDLADPQIRDAVIPWWSAWPRPPQHRSLQIRDLSSSPPRPIGSAPPPVKKFYFQIERRVAAVCRQCWAVWRGNRFQPATE